MASPAKVVKTLTKGYSEVLLPVKECQLDADCELSYEELSDLFSSESEHAVAEGNLNVRRGDIVLVETASAYNTRGARSAYLMVIVMFVLGCFLGKALKQSLPDMLLTGAILAFLNFILAWIMNRRARLRRRLDYRMLALMKKAPHFLD